MSAKSELDIVCKRAYEAPASDDGYRVLVDRLWPRGRSKQDLKLNDWAKSLAPSDELRQWFDHDPAKWAAFYQKYHKALKAPEHEDTLMHLVKKARTGRLTLVYGARDTAHNNAVALKMLLETLA